MKHLTILAATLAALATGLLAQTGTFTSPKGYDTTEGATSHGYILGSQIGLRWQQIDSTLKGTPTAVKSIAWRRDGNLTTNSAYAQRTLEIEVVLANSSLPAITTNHDANYIGKPTVVVTKKSVNFPDWTQQPTSAPAPFFKVPFDNQWAYAGQDDFLWEVRVTKNSGHPYAAFTNYPFDFQYVVSGSAFSRSASGATNGTGCVATGRTSPFALSTTWYNHAAFFRMRHSCSNGPSNAPVVTHLGLSDPNQTLPGLCAAIRAMPQVPLPMGTTSATGSIASQYIAGIPYVGAIVGQPLYLQAAALDAGQAGIPVALSSGNRITVPADPVLPAVGRVYSYLLSNNTVTFSGPWTGGIIAQFEQ